MTFSCGVVPLFFLTCAGLRGYTRLDSRVGWRCRLNADPGEDSPALVVVAYRLIFVYCGETESVFVGAGEQISRSNFQEI